jgi:hypothetical protein
MPQFYEQVTLARDVPEYNLKRGDSAILVDTVPHPKGGEEGYVLELFNDAGESVNVVIVPKSAIIEEEKSLETPNESSSPQVIQNFYGNVNGVAGNVQGNQINQREGKD